jgi:hypothetical protein
MAVRLYFERLTRGMHTKLATRYTTHADTVDYNGIPSMKTTYNNDTKPGFLNDAVKRTRVWARY